MEIREPSYELGSFVYHIISGEKGIIVDACYYLSYNTWWYLVKTGFNEYNVCEDDLTDDPSLFLNLN